MRDIPLIPSGQPTGPIPVNGRVFTTDIAGKILIARISNPVLNDGQAGCDHSDETNARRSIQAAIVFAKQLERDGFIKLCN